MQLTFSYYLYGNEDHYNEIRLQIYELAKNNKNEIKQFFIEESNK